MSNIKNVNQSLTISTVENRTWRVQCFTEKGSDYEFQALRESISYDAQGNEIKRERGRVVSRKVSQVLNEPDAMAMLAAVRVMADRWEEEDIQKEQAQ